MLTRTRIGLVMRATQYDREIAQAFGIPVDRVYAAVFALGAMLAAVAAVLIVPIQQAHYLMGLDPLLLSFIVVIIGGLGSIKGTLVAALRHRHERRHHLRVLLADAGQDPRDAARRAGARLPAAGPVRERRRDETAGIAQALALHLASIALLFALQFVLPAYHHLILARVMVLAAFAVGYNILFGYTGLLQPRPRDVLRRRPLRRRASPLYHLGWSAPAAFLAGLVAGLRCSRSSSAWWRCAPPASPS